MSSGEVDSPRTFRLSGTKVRKQNDFRTDGQIDRDRILYCTAFRRLAEITQVVQAAEGHQFHNRLTHVLKVAQIGRRIAERLLRQERGQEKAVALGGLDPDVVEAAGLAHDLGHPPFGHIAETELQILAKEAIKTDEGFEGNAQSFRIVNKLAVRTNEQGLDLTRATLNAILKYPWSKQPTGYESEKWGVYDTENRQFDDAREAAPYKNSKTLEAELMDWADDVAYAVYDLDDFYRAGLIPLDRLLERSDRHFEALFKNIEARWKRRRMPVTDLPAYKTQFDKLLKLLSTRHPLQDAYSGTRAQRAALRDVTSFLVNRCAGAVELAAVDSVPAKADDSGLIRGPKPLLIQEEVKMEVAILKELAWTYVIENPALTAQQEGQKEIIRLLFEKFSTAALNQDWRIFPASMRSDVRASRTEWAKDPVMRTRVVIDLISSMTEVQAIEMHRRLTGFSFGSVLHRIIH
jgi:dGTPase